MDAVAPPPPGPQASPRGRRVWPLVALALAAVAACWNPVAAPFGLVVGVATAILALRARRDPERRRAALAVLAVSVIAVITSAGVLARTAGSLGADLPGEPVVKGRSAAELDQVLSEAAARTKERRDRAVQELDAQRGRSAVGAPGGAPPAPKDRP